MARAACLRFWLLVSCLAVVNDAHAQVVFQEQSFEVGASNAWIATGDLNADGKSDVVSVVPSENSVGVSLGLGNGAYGPVAKFLVANGPFKARVADVTGDGKLDVVALSHGSPGIITVLAGDGAGSLGAAKSFTVVDDPTDLTVADFTSDGRRDVVVSSGKSKTISLLTNTGSGFSRADSVPWNFDFDPADTPYISALASADFDGDGKQDLVAGTCCFFAYHDYGQQAILPGNGNGTFGMPRFVDNLRAIQIETQDVTGDGKPDLSITGTCGGSVCDAERTDLAENIGNFGFNSRGAQELNEFWIDQTNAVYVDIDGDGSRDLVEVARGFFFGFYQPYVVVSPGTADGKNVGPGYKVALMSDIRPVNLVLQPGSGSGSLPTLLVSDEWGHFTVLKASTSANCQPPATDPGIRVCTPANNTMQPTPFTVRAGVGMFDYPVYRFELWADHTKVATSRENQYLNTSLSLSPGSHLLEFVARSTNNEERHVRAITVNTGQCAAPVTTSVNICSPADGAVLSGTFQAKAFATISGSSVYRFELWANGVKQATVRDSGIMDVPLTLTPGSYRLEFVARDVAGARTLRTVRITVN
jgi:hypothetical protein